MRVSIRFLLGVILLVINQPFGWGALVVFALWAVKTQKAVFYLIGVAAYALSWGLLGLGVLLAGPEGIPYLWNLLGKTWGWMCRFEMAHHLRRKWRKWRSHWQKEGKSIG